MGIQITGTAPRPIGGYEKPPKTSPEDTTGEASRSGTSPGTDQSVPKTAQREQPKEADPQQEAQVWRQIQELLQIQNKVIVHEQAHMAAGGEFAGSASYTYTTGPDGKRYITGGEVPISTPAVKEPEEKLRVMGRVRAAALAPADPSPQDLRVAAAASAGEAEARMEISRKRAEEAYGAAKAQGSKNTSPDQSEEETGKSGGRSAASGAPPPGTRLDLVI